MLELLAPAGSPEAVVAAVQNGADSVYMGFGELNARRNAANFTDEDLEKAADYCRRRGAKVYVTLNILTTDRELSLAESLAKKANRFGVDAILVQDLGVLAAVKQAVPDMPIHASTQMGIHNLDGVRRAAELGASRVVLARELSKAHIAYICKNSPFEIEVFAHGALCMSYSGQCYMSAVIGQRSGNRGLCAQPCRLGYSLGGVAGSPLSLKDCCLINHLDDLQTCGVSCIKIEGRMKRPEYTGIVTRIYSGVLREHRDPTDEEMRLLGMAFSRQGFTDAYFQGEKGPDMLGVRTEDNRKEFAFFKEIRKKYLTEEAQRIPLKLYFMAKRGQPVALAAEDPEGRVAKATGALPQAAQNHPLEKDELTARLSKTGGTPFYLDDVVIALEDGLNTPASEINALRRAVAAELIEQMGRYTPRPEGDFHPGYQLMNREEPPELNLSFQKVSQISDELLDLKPNRIYLPLEELAAIRQKDRPLLERDDLTVAVTLPRVILDSEREKAQALLRKVRRMGVNEALVGNLGHIDMARKEGFAVRGDFGLNVFNAQTLKLLKALELLSATLSFELNMPQLRDLSKCMDTELIAYGRLPLMVTENCIIKNTKGRCQCDGGPVQLSDRKGSAFPVIKESGCRNVILNAHKLFLADRMDNLEILGLWAIRLLFTTENARECVQVTERYRRRGDYVPSGYTRGLYYRGVE